MRFYSIFVVLKKEIGMRMLFSLTYKLKKLKELKE